MLEYKINDFLTLKLEEGITRIYVKGEEFLQCIRLAINIPISNTLMYDEVESIDQASEIYERIVHENQLLTKDQTFQGDFLEITPEQEFWGHCSNLQVWVEHQYDTHLLQNIIFRNVQIKFSL